MSVPLNGSAANVSKAEKYVLHDFNADFYLIPSIYTHPHSGAGVSHVQSAQYMTAGHEVGHTTTWAGSPTRRWPSTIPPTGRTT